MDKRDVKALRRGEALSGQRSGKHCIRLEPMRVL